MCWACWASSVGLVWNWWSCKQSSTERLTLLYKSFQEVLSRSWCNKRCLLSHVTGTWLQYPYLVFLEVFPASWLQSCSPNAICYVLQLTQNQIFFFILSCLYPRMDSSTAIEPWYLCDYMNMQEQHSADNIHIEFLDYFSLGGKKFFLIEDIVFSVLPFGNTHLGRLLGTKVSFESSVIVIRSPQQTPGDFFCECHWWAFIVSPLEIAMFLSPYPSVVFLYKLYFKLYSWGCIC